MITRIRPAVIGIVLSALAALSLAAWPLLSGPPPALASQNNLYNPTTGTLSGLSMVQGFNNAIDSVNTCNSGASAPSNQLLGGPSAGNCWYNTATGAVNFYDGTNWLTIGYIDATNHVFTPVVGGGAAASVAGAATTNLCGAAGAAPTQSFLSITGTTAITSFGANCAVGQIKILSFAGALTLTASSAIVLPNSGGNITTAAGDIAVALYLGAGNWQIVVYQKANGAALSTVGLNIGASALAPSALGSLQQPVNLQLNATVSASQLTVAVKGVNGADPSATNPVLVGFRDATGTGTVVSGLQQAALSFTLAATSSMGCTTGITCRLWVELICQTISSGSCMSILAGLSVQSTATTCFPLDETALQSTGAGTSGGTTAGVIQTSVASLSSRPIRIVGYVEATWTSGTGWAAPSNIQLFGPGIKKPCERVGGFFISTSSFISSANTYNPSNTAPAPTNGALALSQAYTPTSAINILRLRGQVSVGSSSAPGSNICTAFLYNGSSTVAASIGGATIGGWPNGIVVVYQKIAGSTSSTTWSLYGASQSANTNINGQGGGQLLGGTSSTFLELEEIMG
jgi:hypothetical protein